MDILKKLFKSDRINVAPGNKKIHISEDSKYKSLKFNDVVQSRISKVSSFGGDYWDIFPPLVLAFEKPKVLMIGLGGGTIINGIRTLVGNDVFLDVVEINNEVIRLYKEFFKWDSLTHIYNNDGFEHLKYKKSYYDIIILDAYDIDKIPEKFLSDEFINISDTAIKKNGILAINCIDSMRLDGGIKKYIERLKKKFFVFSIAPGFITANSILLCSKDKDFKNKIEKIKEKLYSKKEHRFLVTAYSDIIEE